MSDWHWLAYVLLFPGSFIAEANIVHVCYTGVRKLMRTGKG